jgi:hypothetical protein
VAVVAIVVVVAAVAVVVVVAFGVLFLVMALAAVLMVVVRRSCWLAIQAFTITARWSCHLVMRHMEQSPTW